MAQNSALKIPSMLVQLDGSVLRDSHCPLLIDRLLEGPALKWLLGCIP